MEQWMLTLYENQLTDEDTFLRCIPFSKLSKGTATRTSRYEQTIEEINEYNMKTTEKYFKTTKATAANTNCKIRNTKNNSYARMRQQMCRYQINLNPFQIDRPHASTVDMSYLTPVNADEVVEAYIRESPEDVEIITDQQTETFKLQYTRVAATATPTRVLTAYNEESDPDEVVYCGFTPSPSLYEVSSNVSELLSSTMDDDENELTLLENILRSETDCI